MKLTPSQLLFVTTLITGTLITISSSTWLGIWIGLEINLLSFIPLIAQIGKFSAEAALKYLLVQAFASTTLLTRILRLHLGIITETLAGNLINVLIIFSLIVKLGAAPTHFWFPEVSNGLGWATNIVLITWQKIAPFVILIYLATPLIYIVLIVGASATVGALGGFNQTSLRKILAFSSINHIAWILIRIYISQNIWSTYFLIYSIITIIMIIYFNRNNINFIHQLYQANSSNPIDTFAVSFNILSIGGLPPFLGFYPKWIIMEYIINTGLYRIAIYIISMTLIVLYFYIRITYSSFILFSSTLKPNFYNTHPTSSSSILVWTTILGLAPAPLLILI